MTSEHKPGKDRFQDRRGHVAEQEKTSRVSRAAWTGAVIFGIILGAKKLGPIRDEYIGNYLSRAFGYSAHRAQVFQEDRWRAGYIKELTGLPDNALQTALLCGFLNEPIDYYPREGDTLWELERRFDTTRPRLLEVNAQLLYDPSYIATDHLHLPPTRDAISEAMVGVGFQERAKRDKKAWSSFLGYKTEYPEKWLDISQRAGRVLWFARGEYKPSSAQDEVFRDLCIFFHHGHGRKLDDLSIIHTLASYALAIEVNPLLNVLSADMERGTYEINRLIQAFKDRQREQSRKPVLVRDPLPLDAIKNVVFMPELTDEKGIPVFEIPDELFSEIFRIRGTVSWQATRELSFPFVYGVYGRLSEEGLTVDQGLKISDLLWKALLEARVQGHKAGNERERVALATSMKAVSIIGWKSIGVEDGKIAAASMDILYLYYILKESGIENAFELILETALTGNMHDLLDTYDGLKTLKITVAAFDAMHRGVNIVGLDYESTLLEFLKDWRRYQEDSLS